MFFFVCSIVSKLFVERFEMAEPVDVSVGYQLTTCELHALREEGLRLQDECESLISEMMQSESKSDLKAAELIVKIKGRGAIERKLKQVNRLQPDDGDMECIKTNQQPVDVVVSGPYLYILFADHVQSYLKSGHGSPFGAPLTHTFVDAKSIAATDAHVFVVDGCSVFVFTKAGHHLRTLDDFTDPTCVTANNDAFFVMDMYSRRIQQFSNFEPEGVYVTDHLEFFSNMVVDGDRLLITMFAFDNSVCAIDIKTGRRTKLFELLDENDFSALHIASDDGCVYVSSPNSVRIHSKNSGCERVLMLTNTGITSDGRDLFAIGEKRVLRIELLRIESCFMGCLSPLTL